MNVSLIIMAAGMGSRYGGLKQIDPLGPNGEILIEYAIFDAIRAGFTKVIFVIRKDFESDFKKRISNKFDDHIEVRYAFQSLDDLPKNFVVPKGRTKPWGTGQAVLCCKELINEPFVVQNADDFYGADAYQTIFKAFKILPDEACCLVGYPISKTLSPHGSVTRGICSSDNNILLKINERMEIKRNKNDEIIYIDNDQITSIDENSICSMNFWGFSSSYINILEDNFISFLTKYGNQLKSEWLIPEIVDYSINKNKTEFHVLSSKGDWFGVTYPEDKKRVMNLLSDLHHSGQYPKKLWN